MPRRLPGTADSRHLSQKALCCSCSEVDQEALRKPGGWTVGLESSLLKLLGPAVAGQIDADLGALAARTGCGPVQQLPLGGQQLWSIHLPEVCAGRPGEAEGAAVHARPHENDLA